MVLLNLFVCGIFTFSILLDLNSLVEKYLITINQPTRGHIIIIKKALHSQFILYVYSPEIELQNIG
jgi:hypothetical protein